MASGGHDTTATRQRVLESACRLFALKGYRDTTVQEICEQAHANIAAVNYYFRDKESLYVEAMRHAHDLAAAAYPLDGGLPRHAAPEERLRAHLDACVRCILNDGPPSYFHHMLVKEMAEPTMAHRTVRKLVAPFRNNMRAILGDLLGSKAPAKLRRLCAFSTISQFLFLGFNRTAREQVFQERGTFVPPTIDEVVDHMTRFALAGVRVARHAAARPGPPTAHEPRRTS